MFSKEKRRNRYISEESHTFDIPQRNDQVYIDIENYNDYEYTNCIAYQMLIRTEKFIKLIDTNESERDSKWENKIKECGLNHMDVLSMHTKRLYYYNFFLHDKNNHLHPRWEKHSSLTIGSIENGLDSLIKYYFDKKEIYSSPYISDDELTTLMNRLNNFKKVNVEYEEILNNLSKYAIVGINHRNKDELILLDENIYLSSLKKEFLKTLSINEEEQKYIPAELSFKTPKLWFKEAKIVTIPINVNLPEDELIAYIKGIKKTYNKNNNTVGNIFEILGGDIEKGIEPGSKNKLSKEKNTLKYLMADAFYIYDMYMVMNKIYKDMKNKKIVKKNSDIKLIKKRNNLDGDQKKSCISQIKSDYADEIVSLSKISLENDIIEYTEFTKNKVQICRAFMNHYIKNEKYKNLIIGEEKSLKT